MRQAAFEDRFETTITEPSDPNLLYTHQQCDLRVAVTSASMPSERFDASRTAPSLGPDRAMGAARAAAASR
jgi:type I restriction enzyme R subunit